MAVKKTKIIPDEFNDMSAKLRSAQEQKPVVAEPMPTAAPIVQAQVHSEPTPPKKIDGRLRENKSADRGPMLNVHVPLEIKNKLMNVKMERWSRGDKVTVDTIIYEAILEYLNKIG